MLHSLDLEVILEARLQALSAKWRPSELAFHPNRRPLKQPSHVPPSARSSQLHISHHSLTLGLGITRRTLCRLALPWTASRPPPLAQQVILYDYNDVLLRVPPPNGAELTTAMLNERPSYLQLDSQPSLLGVSCT